MNDFTNDVEKGMRYTWGPIVKTHSVGQYQIIEHKHRKTDIMEFHAYVDGWDTHHSFDTLEAAIVGAIAYKFDGCNTQAGKCFMKMIADPTPISRRV